MLMSLLILANVVSAVLLVIIILLQRSEDSLGGALGGSNPGGSALTKNPLARPTTILGITFMVTALMLGWLIAHQKEPESVVEKVQMEVEALAAPAELPTPDASE